MKLLRILSSDWMKTKRTSIRILLLVSPIFYPLLILWYFCSFTKPQELAYNIHITFFQLGTVFLPMAAGLFSGILSTQEEHAGDFIGMMTQPVSRGLIYLSKLLLLIVMLAGVIFESMGILLIGMKILLHMEQIEAGLFFQSSVLAVAGMLPLCSFYLFLGIRFGLGASISAGSAGLLIAAIFGTTVVGDLIWPYIPFAWSVRISWAPIVRMSGVDLPDSMTNMDFFIEQLRKGLIPAICCFLFFTIISLVWFRKWEGRKSHE
ncbi:lantibiotic immunity ABC transporter MutG family permease subunit [Clostridium sp. E02]|uniref:lantibiotic immunity ABC transporter MutG family permease subunit n=1 Tax=Clostridium sp. E02 TaxID=2487134 RepID=UPI000F5253ED|nr:lantibiotic immunity ABC transporter MutG family permease subunit [Clostridium sp. E02]